MFEYTKAKMNKSGSIYNKNKKKIQYTGNCDMTDTLSKLCVETAKENKRIIQKFHAKLHLKFFFRYELPLAALVAASYFNLQSPKHAEVVPYYNLEQHMLCDNKIISDVDNTNYIHLPFSAELEGDFFEIDEISNVVQYQVKSGTRSAIVTVKLDEQNQMSVVDSLVGNFFDKNADVFKDIEESELDEKYTELVNDIGDFILEDQNMSSTVKKEIQKLLESEKATIITTVAEYVKVGEINLEEKDSRYWFRVGGIQVGLVLAAIMLQVAFAYLFKCKYINGLYYEEEKLEESSNEWEAVPFRTFAKARDMYIRVDDIRKTKIRALVKEELSEESQKLFK